MELYWNGDGAIQYLNGEMTPASELFNYLNSGNKIYTLDKKPSNLSFSRKPAALEFDLVLNPLPKFNVFARREALSQDAIEMACNLGYFILGSRLFFVPEELQADLKLSQSDCSLVNVLKLVRKFKTRSQLKSEPPNIVAKLDKPKRIQKEQKLFTKELYPYQVDGVDWLCFCSKNGLGTILADDMGLGKTAQMIALICDVIEQNATARVLIVVPNPLLDNWCREFAFFAPSLTPYVHYGPNRRGLSDELIKHQIIISPYTTVSSDISMVEEISFDLALFDEASMLKNPESSRTLAAKRINAVVKIAMTGTPVENSLVDAWSITDLVFPGYLGSKRDFEKRYISKDLEETLQKNLTALESHLSQITLRRMKKDVLKQLPEKQDIHLPISMSDSERQEYENLISEIKNDCETGGANVLALINQLQQFTSHPAQLDKSLPRTYSHLVNKSSKYQVLFMHLEKIYARNEKVLIFATFQDTIDLIAAGIQEKFGSFCGKIDGRTPNEERQKLIDELDELNGFGALILHPRTAGMGLNITCANNVIHYSRQWNPALEEQATARAWRNGQKQLVNAYYFYYANTIEEDIDLRLRLKQELSSKVVSISSNKETDKTIMLDYLARLEE